MQPPRAPGLTVSNREFLQRKIQEISGIVITESKQYLLEARLNRVLERRKLQSINGLCDLLRGSPKPELIREVIEAMTTHETYFFRDPSHFQVLQRHLLPDLMKRRVAERKISFWSAAASRGQEAYSLAITASELQSKGFLAPILGTDLSASVLKQARAAVYTEYDVSRGLTREQLQAHFERHTSGWVVSNPIRKTTRFVEFDLRTNPQCFGRFDVVFCRNVMIYFDPETRRRILKNIHSVLAKDGVLFLGSTESMMGLDVPFERCALDGAVFHRPL